MRKSKKDKTMTVEILGSNPNVGVLVNGEICKPGDVVPAGVLTGKGLIHRGRAKPYTEASAKASAKASK